MVFGKKDEGNQAKSDVPVQAVMSMKQRGMTNEQVIEQLKSQGYSLQAIRDALTQADVKQSAVSPAPPALTAPVSNSPQKKTLPAPELPPLPGANEPVSPARGGPGLNEPTSFGAPTPPPAPAPTPSAPAAPSPQPNRSMRVEEMERILEEIVDERWKDVTSKFSNLEAAKSKNETRIDELDKRVNQLSSRMDEISSVIMSRVDEYKKTMEDVDVEIKALEKVMQKLVPSMAEQVKDLKDVVGGLKGGAKPLTE